VPSRDPKDLAKRIARKHTRSLALLAAESGVRFITREVAEIIHSEMLTQFGGLQGFSNAGGLESALARPAQMISYTDERRIGALAAGLAFSVVKNHPFLDGNKRSGFALLDAFLDANDCDFEAEVEDVVNIFTDLAADNLSESEFIDWVLAHTAKRTTKQ
jgi:death-on-curing protein